MRTAIMTILVGMGRGGVGFYVGHHGPSAELRSAHAAVSPVEPAPAASAQAPGVCVASVDRQVLREELARALGGGAGADTPAAAPVPAKQPPPPTPAQAAAFDDARQGVDGALARGSLTSEQADDLRARLLKVDPESHYQLVTELVVALNHGKLKVENGDMIF